MTGDQRHRNDITYGQHLNRHADRPYVFYFFSTAQKILKFSQRTIGTFASNTSQHINPSLQKSQISKAILEHHIDKIIKGEKFTHPPKTDNKGEKSYFNRLKFELN